MKKLFPQFDFHKLVDTLYKVVLIITALVKLFR